MAPKQLVIYDLRLEIYGPTTYATSDQPKGQRADWPAGISAETRPAQAFRFLSFERSLINKDELA